MPSRFAARILTGPASGFAARIVTGATGHFVAGALDWLALIGHYVTARAAGRDPWA